MRFVRNDRPMQTSNQRWRERIGAAGRVAAVAAALCLLASAAQAQEARFAGSWIDEATDLRSAFREVVTAARQSTVRVLVGDKPLALGAIVAGDGWILSKGSDLQGQDLRCRLSDGRELPAALRSYDQDTDLALLKVNAEGLTPLHWRKAADPAVGEWLATVGQDPRPRAIGIVSVDRRQVPAQRISGVLGIVLDESSDSARIDEIIAESAAAQATLQPGDVIMRVADKAIENRRSLIRLIREYEPGTTLDLTIRRGEVELVLPATLTHPFGQFLSRIAAQNHMGGGLSLRRTGFPAVIQHDTVLSPEDCGGPVVDLDGAAIGLNIARAGRTESFALPADIVQAALTRLQSSIPADPQLATDPPPPESPADPNTTSVNAGAQ